MIEHKIDKDAQALPLGGYDLMFPVLHEQLPWEHKPSRARYDWVVLPWPTLIFEPWIQNRPGGEQLPQGYLIGDACPSFPSYQAAFRAFFYGDFAGTPGRQLPSGFGVVRVVDGHAWLDKVRITPAELEVGVAGSNVAGARVELNSATYRADARVTGTGQVGLPLPDGLPAGAWLYLSRSGSGWITGRSASTVHQPSWLTPGWKSSRQSSASPACIEGRLETPQTYCQQPAMSTGLATTAS
jgi:hypothetical protein